MAGLKPVRANSRPLETEVPSKRSNGPDSGRFSRQISSGGHTTINDLFLDLWVLAFPSRQGYGLSVLMLDNKTFMAMIAIEQINALCLLRFRAG